MAEMAAQCCTRRIFAVQWMVGYLFLKIPFSVGLSLKISP